MDNYDNNLAESVSKRRTFAIISHPDAGKTTLTEKLLLFGGAIRLAGTVKGRKSTRHATSDWMEIEQQRGISVTSSVMQFSYKDFKVNILDTPGHQDFSEDTYRTLTAADSAVMLIDAAKGVEAQTIKLFEVCRMKSIPIFTFINKLDRHGKEPLELLEEIESVLGIRSCPMNWPIGMGRDFRGIYDREKNRLELFNTQDKREFVPLGVDGVEDPVLSTVLDETLCKKLREDISLLDIAGDPFDFELIRTGKLTPVFFGSAITNFGVQTFLDDFLSLAPPPNSRASSIGPIDPAKMSFSGFVFKIQANMNPAHRDRIAFLRICSGEFRRGMSVTHTRLGKKVKLAQPQQFLAQGRDIVEEAYPGDIIGLFDPGIFLIGDTLCEEGSFQYEKLPQFSPEFFARVTVRDAMKHKQFQKGIHQLAEEGAVQIFKTTDRTEDIIVGVIGQLQFEVFEYRLKAEYGADISLYHLPYSMARWVKSKNPDDWRQLYNSSGRCLKDQYDRIVVLFENDFALNWAKEKHPDISFCHSYELTDN